MKGRVIDSPEAHDLLVRAIRGRVLPASRLPQVLAAWDTPRLPEFAPRTAWSLVNAFTEVRTTGSMQTQVQQSLKLMMLFRSASAE